jgi:hypothetical protein
VRLDPEAERALQEIQAATGLPISEALKRGLRSLQAHLSDEPGRSPYDIYLDLDIGPGGYAITPSSEVRRGVRKALERKRQR